MSEPRRTRTANGRSSIFADDHGRWHGWVSAGISADGKPVRRHVRGRTKSEVTTKVRKLEAEREAGLPPKSGRRPTVSSYLAGWIVRRSLDVRPATISGYKTDQGYIDRTIGNIRLDKLLATDIEACWKAMVTAGRLASVSHTRRTLKACLEDATREGLLARNPAKDARVPKYEPPEIEVYSAEEIKRFLDAVGERRNAPRWALAALLGLRQGEVLGLQWSDFDEAQSTVTVRRQVQRVTWNHGCADPSECTKRGANCPLRHGGGIVESEPKSRAGRRPIPLPPLLNDALVAHRRKQVSERLAAEVWLDGDWMFPTPWGAVIDHRVDWQEFKDIRAEAGLRPARLHALRHSAATVMIEAKIDYSTAGAILGHGSITQTSKYVHVLADRKRAAADLIGDIYGSTETSS